MKGIEEVYSGKKLVAVVYRSNIPVEGVKFLTPPDNHFQIGLHSRQKGLQLPPHVHKTNNSLKVDSMQEVLYVVEGKIRVNLYSQKGQLLKRKTLSSGDSILLASQGHGVDFLENSRIFEVKQGPYLGAAQAKVYFK